MILVDSNIPMYLIGAPHPHKTDASRITQELIARGDRLVTDTEVLQEILHRYVTIGRREAIQPAFDALLGIVDEVLPIDRQVCERAKNLVLALKGVSARDCIHASVMEHHEVEYVFSFDQDFDRIPGVKRISASNV